MEHSNEDINAPNIIPNAPQPYTIFIDPNMTGKELRCNCSIVFTWLDSNNTLISNIKDNPVISEYLMRKYKYDTSKDNVGHDNVNESNDRRHYRRSPSYHSHSRDRDYQYSSRHSRSRYDYSHSPSPYSRSHHHKHRSYSRSRSRRSHSRKSFYDAAPLIQQQPIENIQRQHPQKPLLLTELEDKYAGKTMNEVGEDILVNEILNYNTRNGLNTDINAITKQVRFELVKNKVLVRIEMILEYWKQCSLSKIPSFYEDIYKEKIESTRDLGYKKLSKCLQLYGFKLKPVPDDTMVYPTYRKWF